ncbi:hypothetical protein P7C73_g1689, partial [Tremellales sp. Uapishka_1]
MHSVQVALFGVNSRIGPFILSALLESTYQFDLIIVLRPSSQRPHIPSNVHRKIRIVELSDDPSTQQLVEVLHNIDVLVSALSAGLVDLHRRLADACILAGVCRYIPADYGSVRSDDPYALDLLENFRNKQIVRWHLQRLAEESRGEFTWTSLATGHFFDLGLETELLGINVGAGTGKMFDGGRDRWSTSTRAQIGKAVAGVIGHLEQTANKLLLIQSFCVTQLEVADAIRRTGHSLALQKVDSKAFLDEQMRKANRGDPDGVESAVAVLGIKRSNWLGDVAFANDLLELKEETLDEVVQRVLRHRGSA